jgi:hypothetical protein
MRLNISGVIMSTKKVKKIRPNKNCFKKIF